MRAGRDSSATLWPKMVWMANQIARLRITPTTAAVMAERAPLSAAIAANGFDIGRAEENPEKTRHERHPGGKQAAQRACQQRRQLARIAEGCEKADELQHHDQGPGVVSAMPSPSSISPGFSQP